MSERDGGPKIDVVVAERPHSMTAKTPTLADVLSEFRSAMREAGVAHVGRYLRRRANSSDFTWRATSPEAETAGTSCTPTTHRQGPSEAGAPVSRRRGVCRQEAP